MVKRTIHNHDIVFYDNIEDLPVAQFHRYSKYVLVEGGVGDTIQDIDRHITRIINFLNDPKKAYQEILNLRQCLFLIVSEQDVHNKATLCLVKSIDGKEWTDFSDSGLQELYEMINGASEGELTELAMLVRKRVDETLTQYFPNIFEDSTKKNLADLIRQRAILQLGEIINGDDNKEKIEAITEKMYQMQNPKAFGGENSEEIKFDKQFEEMCLVMAKEFGGGIKKYTTLEFYTAFERLSKQYKEIKKTKRRK